MIRVTVELLPHGDATKARHLGTITITNDGTGTRTRGHYVFTLSRRDDSTSTWRRGRVQNFPRLSFGVYDLLYRVLRIAVGERNIEEPNEASRNTKADVRRFEEKRPRRKGSKGIKNNDRHT